jgi:hypothetical protein
MMFFVYLYRLLSGRCTRCGAVKELDGYGAFHGAIHYICPNDH